MAKLIAKHKVIFLGDATATLREPTTEEWNEYNKERFKIVRKKKVAENNEIKAKCNLFDKICLDIDNLYDENDQPVKVDRIHLIPAYEKQKMIFSTFEEDDVTEDDAKN